MKNNPIYLLILIFFSASIAGSSLRAQSKTDEHKLEMVTADAYAVAWQNCKQSLSVYQLNLNPADKKLATTTKELSLTQVMLNNDMALKYPADSPWYTLFNQEIKNGTKVLATCIRYQNILDAKTQTAKPKKK